MKKLTAIGNALVDILIPEANDDLLHQFQLKKGSMTHIGQNELETILKELSSVSQLKCGGGSAANTVHALGILQNKVSFIGKVGRDELGIFYRRELQDAAVETSILESNNHTGCAIGFITPDAERTFATYLGAAVELNAGDISPELFKKSDIVHIEGYLVQDYNLIEKSILIAKSKGCLVSLDLSSFNVVEEHHAFFDKIISSYVDIVFANEQEAAAFWRECDPERLAQIISVQKLIAVLKLGKNGSIIAAPDKTYFIPAAETVVKDTTGAGDLYAAGFFYGFLNDLPLFLCGKIGALLAARSIEEVGARIAPSRWAKIKTEITKLISEHGF